MLLPKKHPIERPLRWVRRMQGWGPTRKELTVDYGEQTTGTRDEHYNLISVLYHALHGAENCDRYASDAEISADEHLAASFREAQDLQTELAERAKGMRGINPASTTSSESGLGVAGGPAPGFDVGPESISGGAPPPVAVVPADVPADVPEPTVVRVPPEDLDTTIRALEGGPGELPVEEALDE